MVARKESQYKSLQFVEEGALPFPNISPAVHMYTDGSLKTTKSKVTSGCGIVWWGDGIEKSLMGVRPPTDIELTITAVELYAVYEALNLAAHYGQDIVLHTDSKYVWEFFHIIRHRFCIVGFQLFQSAQLLKEIQLLCSKIERENANTHSNQKARKTDGKRSTNTYSPGLAEVTLARKHPQRKRANCEEGCKRTRKGGSSSSKT